MTKVGRKRNTFYSVLVVVVIVLRLGLWSWDPIERRRRRQLTTARLPSDNRIYFAIAFISLTFSHPKSKRKKGLKTRKKAKILDCATGAFKSTLVRLRLDLKNTNTHEILLSSVTGWGWEERRKIQSRWTKGEGGGGRHEWKKREKSLL